VFSSIILYISMLGLLCLSNIYRVVLFSFDLENSELHIIQIIKLHHPIGET